MNTNDIAARLETICSNLVVPNDSAVSIAALSAQSRMMSDMLLLVTTCPTGEQYSTREEYIRSGNALFESVAERLGHETVPNTAAELLLTMWDTVSGCSDVTDFEKTACCVGQAETFLKKSDVSALTDSSLQTACCKLMLRNLYDCYRYDEDRTDYERYSETLRRIIGSWVAESPDEGWKGLPDTVALQRIQVMDMYFNMTGDMQYNGRTQQLFGYYCAKAELWLNSETPTEEEIAALGAIYDTSVSGTTCDTDPGQTARIADRLAAYAEHHAMPQSDTWHLCRRITLHDAVDHLVNHCQKKLIG